MRDGADRRRRCANARSSSPSTRSGPFRPSVSSAATASGYDRRSVSRAIRAGANLSGPAQSSIGRLFGIELADDLRRVPGPFDDDRPRMALDDRDVPAGGRVVLRSVERSARIGVDLLGGIERRLHDHRAGRIGNSQPNVTGPSSRHPAVARPTCSFAVAKCRIVSRPALGRQAPLFRLAGARNIRAHRRRCKAVTLLSRFCCGDWHRDMSLSGDREIPASQRFCSSRRRREGREPRCLTPGLGPRGQVGSGRVGQAPGVGAALSVCQSPNSLPCGSVQVENQPMLGTGIASSARPPSSFTRAMPALMSSTSK